MEAEKQQDPFSSQPTASQEAKFPNCPPPRESEIFLDSNSQQFSSSPVLMPSEATGIVVISLPDSSCSLAQPTLEEEGSVFVTAPEHIHLSDQKPNELCAAEARDATKVRFSEVGLDDEPEMEVGQDSDGYIVPLGETDEAAEVEGNEAEISDLNYGAEEIMATSNLDATGEAAMVGIVREIGGLLSNCVGGNNELGENVEAVGVPRAEMPNESRSWTLDSGDIAKIKLIAGKSCLKVRLRIRGFDKAVKTRKDAKKRKESHRSGRVRSGRRRIEEIDEFRYDGTFEERTGRRARGSGSKRPSLKGKGKEVVESSEKRSGSLDILDILKTVFGGRDGGCDCDEDVDFIETAKKKGMTFPRPRWWPDDDEEGYPS